MATFGDNLGIAISEIVGTDPWNGGFEPGFGLLDAVVHLDVIQRSLNTPPGSPANGDRYHIGASPTGVWAGQGGKLAVRRAAEWVFYTFKEGWLLTSQADLGVIYKHESGALVASSASIAANSIDNTELAQMAAHTFKGNNTAALANALDLTTTQLTAELNVFAASLKGLVPAAGAVPAATNFLTETGAWAVPAGGGGSGTVNAGTAKQLAYYPASSAAVSGAAGFEFDAATSPNVKVTAQNAAHVGLRVWSAASPSVSPFEVSANNGTTVHFAITTTGAPTGKGSAGTNSERYGAGSTLGTSTNSTAIGGTAQVSSGSAGSTVVGATTTGADNDVLVGYNITTGGTSNTYIGQGTSGSGAGGVALGRASVTAAAHMVAGSGTHPIADVYFGKGITSTTAASVTIHGTGGSGLNNAGAVLNIAGGRSTGNVAGGSVVIQVAPLGASSSSLNALITSAEFPSVGGMIMPEVASPATPAANSGHWFVKDVGGLSRPHFKGDDGTEFNLTTAGSGANTALSNLASVAINLALKGVDGTVSAPAYAFTSAANSGFFLASSAIQTAIGGGAVFAQYANGARVANNGRYEFSSDATPVGTADVLLSRFAANVMRVGGNAAGNTPGMLLVGPSDYSQTGGLTSIFMTATTNAVVDTARIGVFSTGTPAAGFGGRLSLTAHTTTNKDILAAALDFSLPTATHASYKGRMTLWAKDSAGEREGLRIEASGSAPMLGVLGAAAVVRQTAGAATAGVAYTSTEQTMLQVVYDALRTFGFTT